MLRFLMFVPLALLPVEALAFQRPIPQPQSATAEFWFAFASIMLCVALYAVHRIVSRR